MYFSIPYSKHFRSTILGERVFGLFWAPFGASNPLGYFPAKCNFEVFFLCLSFCSLFAFPYTYADYFPQFRSLRWRVFSFLFRSYPSCSKLSPEVLNKQPRNFKTKTNGKLLTTGSTRHFQSSVTTAKPFTICRAPRRGAAVLARRASSIRRRPQGSVL